MGETSNFGLEKFGAEGSISQNGYKFSNKDRDSIDSLLYTLFLHDHREADSTALAYPARPGLTEGTGGTINAGATYFYRVAFVDSNGNETAASSESVIVLDGPLIPPTAPTVTTASTGGTLDDGTYRYALTFYQSAGGETTAPVYGIVTAGSAGTNTNTVSLPTPVSGADGWKVYRKGPADARYFLLATVAATATPPTSYVDDGSVLADCTKYPPSSNTTNGSNSITVALDASDLPLDSRIAMWRIYRTKVSGSYSSTSLVVTVTETTTEGGTDLVTSYVDTGTATVTGIPLTISATPPAIAQLDAADVFSSTSSPLPAALAPRGVNNMTVFMNGTLTNKTYHKVYLWHDLYLERLDLQYQDLPSGLDGSNYVTVTVSNDAATPESVSLVMNSELATPDGYYSWQSSTTDYGEMQAEDAMATPDGTQVSDLRATNDIAQSLDTQYDINSWDCGVLEAGEYVAKFYIRDVGQTNGTLVLRVRTDEATPTTLATTTINSPGSIFYDPPTELSFTVTSDVDVIIEAEKTDANSNEFRIDKYIYEVQLPMFAAETYLTIEASVTGSPTDAGGDANLTVWY